MAGSPAVGDDATAIVARYEELEAESQAGPRGPYHGPQLQVVTYRPNLLPLAPPRASRAMQALEFAAATWLVGFVAVVVGLIGHAMAVDSRARALGGLTALGLSPFACIGFLAWRAHRARALAAGRE